MRVVTDRRCVDISIFINLCATHEAHVHVAALEIVGKNILHAHNRKRTADEGGVADGEGQTFRFRADHASFVDHHKVGGMCTFGEEYIHILRRR